METYGLFYHPPQRDLGQSGFLFQITSPNIAVNSGKPDLQRICWHLRIVAPEVLREVCAALIERNRMPNDFYTGIVCRELEVLG